MAQYYQQRFQSKNDPNYFVSIYMWDTDLGNTEKYPKDLKGEVMFPYFEEVNDTFIIKSKMTNAQIKKDRGQRASKHFKKEIYPTLIKGSDEQKHFSKKYNLKS